MHDKPKPEASSRYHGSDSRRRASTLRWPQAIRLSVPEMLRTTIKATARGAALSLTLAIGLASFAGTLVALVIPEAQLVGSPRALFSGLLAVFVVAVLSAARLTVRLASPMEYAELRLAGRTLEKSLLVLSHEIHISCTRFVRGTDFLTARARSLTDALLESRPLEFYEKRAGKLGERPTDLDPGEGTPTQRSESDEAPPVEDDKRRFWIPVGRALSRFREASSKLRVPDPDDALKLSPIKGVEPLRSLFESCELSGLARRRLWRSISRNLRRLDRIKAMKTLTADTFGIPESRLCERILEYSPLVHRFRADRYVRNWLEVSRYCHHISECLSEREREIPGGKGSDDRADAEKIVECQRRLLQLFADNFRIRTMALDRRTRQAVFLRHAYLARKISAIAVEESASEALKHYARAFSDIGRQTARRRVLHKSTAAFEALKLMVRKQRAHSGRDLHQLMRTLLFSPEVGAVAATNTAASSKGGRRTSLNVLDKIERHATVDEDWFDVSKRALLDFELVVDKEIDLRRGLVAERGASELKSFLFSAGLDPGREDTAYILCRGYSKTVRETMRRFYGLDATEASRADVATDPGVPDPIQRETVSLLALRAHGESSLRSQLFRGDLWPDHNGIAVCDERLLSLLSRPGGRVVILIGMESFTDRGAVVSKEDFALLARTRSCLESNQALVRVVAVGEDFKKFGAPQFAHNEGPLARREDLDRGELQFSADVDQIVTDVATYPGARKRVSPPPAT